MAEIIDRMELSKDQRVDTSHLPQQETEAADEASVPSYGLLYITRAYNCKEITFEEWLRRALAWAERTIQQHDQPAPPAPD